jgi:Tfp pilus assembly protein PilN
MRRLNVLPPEFSGIKLPWWHGDPLLAWGRRGCILLATVLFGLVSLEHARLFSSERHYAKIKSVEQSVNLQLLEQRERTALIQTSLESLDEEKTLLEQKLRFVLKYQRKGPFWSLILTDIAGVLNSETQLGRLEGTSEEVVLEGFAPGPQDINALIGDLNQLGRFGNVRLNLTEVQQKEKLDEYRFEIAAGLL